MFKKLIATYAFTENEPDKLKKVARKVEKNGGRVVSEEPTSLNNPELADSARPCWYH